MSVLGDLTLALAAAGINHGEAFEVAVKVKGGEMRSRIFDDPEPAAAWLDAQPEGDRYIGVNPLKASADPPKGRARDVDVLAVRVLVIDIDPGDRPKPGQKDESDPLNVAPYKRAAVRETAATIAKLFRPGAVARVDTGRGVQLWVRHDELAPDDPRLASRALILRYMHDLYSRRGLCHVDTSVGNLARLARLPGTINTKTGELASLCIDAESV